MADEMNSPEDLLAMHRDVMERIGENNPVEMIPDENLGAVWYVHFPDGSIWESSTRRLFEMVVPDGNGRVRIRPPRDR